MVTPLITEDLPVDGLGGIALESSSSSDESKLKSKEEGSGAFEGVESEVGVFPFMLTGAH